MNESVYPSAVMAGQPKKDPEVMGLLGQIDTALQELSASFDEHAKRIDTVVAPVVEKPSAEVGSQPKLTGLGNRLNQDLNMIRGITYRLNKLTGSIEL